MTRTTHHLKRHGLLMLVLVTGVFIYLATSDVGAAMMFAALAYIGGSVIQVAARHRLLKINGVWWVLGGLGAATWATVHLTGDDSWLLKMPVLGMLALIVLHAIWTRVELWRNAQPGRTRNDYWDDWTTNPAFKHRRGNAFNRHYRFVNDDD